MNNLNEVQSAGQTACAALIEKAWENPVFKDELIRNPTDAFKFVTGVPFPSTHKIVAEDQSDDSIIYLNIPARPDISELELTDEQLEMVAGGASPILGVAAVCLGATLGVGAILFVGACVVGYYANS